MFYSKNACVTMLESGTFRACFRKKKIVLERQHKRVVEEIRD